MADEFDWKGMQSRYPRYGGRPSRYGPGHRYRYGREHEGQWQGYEPVRRDYGSGYRPAYTYGEEDQPSYDAGYRYSAEHDDWASNEPVRRDYGWHHGPGYDPTYENVYARRGQDYEGNPEAPYLQPWERPGPHTGKGPKNYERSDERIMEDVCERLTRHGGVDASQIEVEVADGEVFLSGVMPDRRSKRIAEDAVASVAGVWDVQNRLTIPRPGEGPDEQG